MRKKLGIRTRRAILLRRREFCDLILKYALVDVDPLPTVEKKRKLRISSLLFSGHVFESRLRTGVHTCKETSASRVY